MPALGRSELTADYDRVIEIMTRERRWRTALLELVDPVDDDVVVDFGAGTGTLGILVKQRAPKARVVCVDPDPAVLAIAATKASSAGVRLEFIQAMGDDAVSDVGEGVATKVVSSLVLHQCPLAMKAAILAAMWRCARPGGRLCIADYGLQRTMLMKMLFKQVQALDGWENTDPNAKGVLPDLMRGAGFENVEECRVIPTPTGSISLYAGRRPS